MHQVNVGQVEIISVEISCNIIFRARQDTHLVERHQLCVVKLARDVRIDLRRQPASIAARAFAHQQLGVESNVEQRELWVQSTQTPDDNNFVSSGAGMQLGWLFPTGASCVGIPMM